MAKRAPGLMESRQPQRRSIPQAFIRPAVYSTARGARSTVLAASFGRQHHALAAVHRLKFLGVVSNAEAVAHRVVLFDAPQLANAAGRILDPTRSAKFMMFTLLLEAVRRNRNLNLVRIFEIDPLRCHLAFASRLWRLQFFCTNALWRTTEVYARPSARRSELGALGGLAPKHRGSTYAHSNGKRQMSNA